MAFSCTVYTLDAGAKRRLKLAGIAVPMTAPPGQNPTPKELMEVLSTFSDYQVNLSSSRDGGFPFWHAEVWHSHRPALHPWCFIAIDQYRGDEVSQSFQFVRGSPEFMLRIVQVLAARLGPLVLQPDGQQPPVVVQESIEPSAYIESWRAKQPPPEKRPPLPKSFSPREILRPALEALLPRPDPGYTSKHQYDNWDVEGRLARIEWFANCGRAPSVNLSVSIERADNWEHALALCASSTWEEVELAARNQFTVFLHQNDNENYQNWNRFVQDRQQAVLSEALAAEPAVR